MADSNLQVQDIPKEKKKRKSNLKKSDPSQNESPEVTPTDPAPLPVEVNDPPAPESRKTSLAPPITQGEEDSHTSSPSRSSSIKSTDERHNSIQGSQSPRRRVSEMPHRGSKRAALILEDLDEAKLLELKEAFKLFDMDHDGFISSVDLKLTFGTLGKTNVTDEHIEQMLSEAANPLDFEAFVMLLGFKTIALDPEEILLDALGKWDKNSSGFILEERIKHDLMTWGDKFTSDEVDVALEDAPTFINNGQHVIDYVKFCRLLCGLRKKTKDVTVEDFMT